MRGMKAFCQLLTDPGILQHLKTITLSQNSLSSKGIKNLRDVVKKSGHAIDLWNLY